MPLVLSSDFNRLPLEPIPRWLALRDLLEKRLAQQTNHFGTAVEVLVEYYSTLKAAADELGVGHLPEFSVGDIRDNAEFLKAEVFALATRLSLRTQVENVESTVSLSRPTRREVLILVEKLRVSILNSELPQRIKQRAEERLNELHMQIVAPRTDISIVGRLLTGIGAVVIGTTTMLADLTPAIGTISALIGAEKEEEEAEQTLLQAPPSVSQLEDKRTSIDDEIPF